MVLSLNDSIKLYKKVGHRNPYLFEWLYKIYKKTPLSSINKKYSNDLTLTKTKLTIFDVLIDDIADNIKLRNKTLLQRLTNIPWETQSYDLNDYYFVSKTIWNDCFNLISKYPRFREFEEIFYFDLRQVMNSMEYSRLINTYVYSDNLIENKTYGHHGVMVILHGMMDIMCSDTFDRRELGKTRELLYLAQKAARLGNMLNTYPRELIEKDISSPIITYAIESEDINPFNYESSEEVLLKLKNLESIFIDEVNSYFKEMEKYNKRLKSFNVKKFIRDRRYIHDMFVKRIKYWEK